MPLQKLLQHYHAAESVDKSTFQKHARLLQSIWREEQGFKPADYQGKLRGARLEMPWAKETLANYLTDTIREVVRTEVLDPTRSAGKLYGQPRIFNNLLSSQPLCFNLFGELQRDLELATKVFSELSMGRVDRVVAIDFEHSPGRADVRFTGDSSAFDVFVRFQTPDDKPGFIGIEVKYHENLRDTPARLTARHEEIARNMNCFHADALERLKGRSLKQIWRDHLLAGAMLQNGGFDDGFFVFLAPQNSPHLKPPNPQAPHRAARALPSAERIALCQPWASGPGSERRKPPNPLSPPRKPPNPLSPPSLKPPTEP